MRVCMCVRGDSNSLALPAVQIVNTVPPRGGEAGKGTGPEDSNRENLPPLILGNGHLPWDAAGCGGTGWQGQKTQNGFSGKLAERETENREVRGQAGGWSSLGREWED